MAAGRTPPRQSFSLLESLLFCQLVLSACTSLRGAVRVMSLISEYFAPDLQTPDFTTGRSWILRLGYYKLHRPKVHANDWVWIIDHLTQIGQESCFLITGIRLRNLPPPGQCLALEDLEPIAILPVTKSTGEVVYQQLETQVPKTGVPRAILADRCNDLQNGLRRFGEAHADTSMLYDVAHKAACLLQARLERNPRWKAFRSQVGQTKYQTQQTELAFLVPPTQRSKARYMNLESLLSWANRVLTVVDCQPQEVMRYCTVVRLEEKFGWLRDYRDDVAEWSEYQAVAKKAVDFIRRRGFYRGANVELARQLSPLVRTERGKVLAEEFITFVTEQSAQVQGQERLPGSSEVLESSFGKFKFLEGEQAKGGFTSSILAYGALLGRTTADTVEQALACVQTKHVKTWCQQHLGQTLQSKRKRLRGILCRLFAQQNSEEYS